MDISVIVLCILTCSSHVRSTKLSHPDDGLLLVLQIHSFVVWCDRLLGITEITCNILLIYKTFTIVFNLIHVFKNTVLLIN